jgi:hypothetical protein
VYLYTIYHNNQTSPGAHPTSYHMVTRNSSCWVKGGAVLGVTAHLYLLPRLRKLRAIFSENLPSALDYVMIGRYW